MSMRALQQPRTSPADAAYDVVAIGCGPFNLGLAALAARIEELELVVFEARPELRWHPGLMFDDAMVQLSFLADLVTLVDPTHPLSFLSYLRAVDRLYPFFIRETFHPTRREYQDYLRWAVAQLPNVCFSHRAERVHWDADRERFCVELSREGSSKLRVFTKHLVLGIGTEPALPQALAPLPERVCLHSAEYLDRRFQLQHAEHVTVVGSGQSAAEAVLDLLRRNLEGGPALSWLTRARAFAPLDYTKLVLEMTTPAYIRYFHALPGEVRARLVAEQWQHYKGISADTLGQIYELLYQRELKRGLAPVELRCGVSVESAALSPAGRVMLSCRHRDSGAVLEHQTDIVVSATGYRERPADFLRPMEALVCRDDHGRYRVRLDHSIELASSIRGKIFVANADLHSHGVAAPDLGIGAFRNATILNTILGRVAYRLPERTAFTSFALPVAPNGAVVQPGPASDVARPG